MTKKTIQATQYILRKKIMLLNKRMVEQGLSIDELEDSYFSETETPAFGCKYLYLSSALIVLLCCTVLYVFIENLLGVRCLLPNNYIIWEFTRPISDCSYCSSVTNALILPNVSRGKFVEFAYTSRPIIVKGAALHWPAMQIFTYDYFKKLYESVDDAYESIEESCPLLHFRSDFANAKDFFAMSPARATNAPGEKTWYVGLGNCHPKILIEMRRHFPRPHFLPDDAEYPAREYVFLGYDEGAAMHLDYIGRLMWQAQLKGNKTWHLAPTPECEHVCGPVTFYVEPGDIDTRIWYHSTNIPNGEFSLTLQSEYG